jgi:diacylglycerol kinase family enzyme
MNPGSKGGKSKKRFELIFNLLKDAGINYDYKITTCLNDAYTGSQLANKNKYDVIVAVGGDGTINKVINGFFDASGKRISTAVLGIIYTGTSPDFCKSYGIPLKIKDSVESLLRGNTLKITIGKISCSDKWNDVYDAQSIENLSDSKTIYFGCCANIGLGAALARRSNSGIRKYLGDFSGTFLSLIVTIISFKSATCSCRFEGKPERITNLYNLSVGITPFIASGIKVNNKLFPGEPKFYSLITRKLNLINLPGVIQRIYSGKPIENSSNLTLKYSKSVEVLGNINNPEIEADGDPVGFLPCKIVPAIDQLELVIKGN